MAIHLLPQAHLSEKARRDQRAFSLALLPCVADQRPDGRHFWAVPNTGESRIDHMLGSTLAGEVIRHDRAFDATVLVSVLEDMIREGRVSGVETGFIWQMLRLLNGGHYGPYASS